MTHIDGLRAWLNEVDRALRVRSRLGVVLISIASAAAGVALYLAIDASQHSISGSDVQRYLATPDDKR